MGVDGVELPEPEDEASSLEDSLPEDSREEFSSEEVSELVGAEDSGEEAVSSPDELLKTEEEGKVEAVGVEGGAFLQETAEIANNSASKTAQSFFKKSPSFPSVITVYTRMLSYFQDNKKAKCLS